MSNVTPIDKMNAAINKILNEYSNEIDTNMSIVVTKICAKGAKALRDESAQDFQGKDYKKSWTYTVSKNRLYSNGTIYSKMPGLPHLLEYGHAVIHGGRKVGEAKAHPHILPIAEQMVLEFEKELKNKL